MSSRGRLGDTTQPIRGFASRVHAYRNLDVLTNVPIFMWTTINLDVINFDSMDEFRVATNRFYPRKTGYYFAYGQVEWTLPAVAGFIITAITRSDGTDLALKQTPHIAAQQPTTPVTGLIHLLEGEWVDLRVIHNQPGGLGYWGGVDRTYLVLHRLS